VRVRGIGQVDNVRDERAAFVDDERRDDPTFGEQIEDSDDG